ncbi:MAG: DAPG hydrolase family protein [Promethearchaeota archaeon]
MKEEKGGFKNMSKNDKNFESNKITEENFKRSNRKTIDLVVDHKLPRVTPEMIDWWWDNINSSERYKLWHPEDHKSFEWEVSPEKGHIGAIQRIIENIGFPTNLRIRWEDPNSSPIPIEYSHALVGSTLNHENKPMSWILHEYEQFENGTKLRTTFRLPANTPKPFIEALRKHNIEEIAEFINFLPELYKENKGI